jgi:hypothetical protein
MGNRDCATSIRTSLIGMLEVAARIKKKRASVQFCSIANVVVAQAFLASARSRDWAWIQCS